MLKRKKVQKKIKQMTDKELVKCSDIIECLLEIQKKELGNTEIQNEEIQKEICKRGLKRC